MASPGVRRASRESPSATARHGIQAPRRRRPACRGPSRDRAAAATMLSTGGAAAQLSNRSSAARGAEPPPEITGLRSAGAAAPEDVCAGLTLATAPVDRLRTFWTFLFPAFGGLLFGYDIGATSGAVPILENEATSGVSWGKLMTAQSGLATSASLLGALLGSIATFLAKDKLGRKTELLIAAGLYGVGALLSAVSVAFPMLVVARIIYGAGFGFALHGAPAYLAEAGHPRVRGFLISMKEVFIGIGIELGYLVSLACVNTRGGWRIVFGVALAPAAVLVVGMLFLPESPRWLLLQGRGEGAKRALRWCRGKYGACANLLDAEFQEMADASAPLRLEKHRLLDVFQRRYLRPLGIGLSLMFFQQVTGQPSVLYYATKIFEQVGVTMGQAAFGIAGVLGAWKLLMTGVATLLVDRLGRRPLLLAGVAGLVASAAALGIAGLAAPGSMATAGVSIAALFAFTGSYQISFGPIGWLIVGEVFPLAVRGAAISLATLTNFGTNWVVTLVLPSIQLAFTPGGTFLGFACVAAISWVVIYFIVPETKGKTLEEIESLFRRMPTPSTMPSSSEVELQMPVDAKV